MNDFQSHLSTCFYFNFSNMGDSMKHLLVTVSGFSLITHYEIDASFKEKLAKKSLPGARYAHYKADFDGPVTPASPRFICDIDQFYTQLVFKY